MKIGFGRGPFSRKAPSPSLPLSPKTFDLIESFFSVFRKTEAGGAALSLEEYVFHHKSVPRSRTRASRRAEPLTPER